MVEVFKTNVNNRETAQKILTQLNEQFPDYKINFDLEDCDKILRVEGRKIKPNLVSEILHTKNVECEIL